MTQNKDIPNRSLLLELEDAILKIESAGWDENSIFAFVNMILKGYITNGAWSEIYLEAAARALQEKQADPWSRTVLTDANGNPLVG